MQASTAALSIPLYKSGYPMCRNDLFNSTDSVSVSKGFGYSNFGTSMSKKLLDNIPNSEDR